MWKKLFATLLQVLGPLAVDWGAKKLTPPVGAPAPDSKVVPFPSPAAKEPLDDARE